MTLCLDAGNSRLKFGLFDGRIWHRRGVLSYDDFDAQLGRLEYRPTRIVACNVAGDVTRQRIEALASGLELPLAWLASSAAACGVRSSYDQVGQLGADRWAALIGARALYSQDCVVVMAGTATTIDTLDRDGLFRGGLIIPGLSMMRDALALNTAGLPRASGHYKSPATNTDDAIVSGAIHATLGAIARMRATLNDGALCLLSGGAAIELIPYLDPPCRAIDNIVLEGLAVYSAVS